MIEPTQEQTEKSIKKARWKKCLEEKGDSS